MSRTIRNQKLIRKLYPDQGLKVPKSHFEKPYYSYREGRHIVDNLDAAGYRSQLTGYFTDKVYRYAHHNEITGKATRFEQKVHRSHARLEIQHFLRGERDDVILRPVQFSPYWLW